MNFPLPFMDYHIEQIFDVALFETKVPFVDQRNRNKKFYNSLLMRKYKKEVLNIEDLTMEDWRNLVIKEKISNKELVFLYNKSLYEINKTRKKHISNSKVFTDEYVFYFFFMYQLNSEILYMNLGLLLLENAKQSGFKTVYEYASLEYRELFDIDEEIERQKRIEERNRLGYSYEEPLTSILLRKFYTAIQERRIDRKLLKNDYFLTYYQDVVVKRFVNLIEKTKILKAYEDGTIYQNSLFSPYPDLYKTWKISQKEVSLPILVPTPSSVRHISKKRKSRLVKPPNYEEIEKTKIEVGNKGEEYVYAYEWEKLKEYPALQEKIERKYLTDSSCGYDIQSYEIDGTPIYIEVKTMLHGSDSKISFFISSNEDAFLRENEKAFIYYIFDLENPKLRIIPQTQYLQFYQKVTQYYIDEDVLE